MYLINSLHHLLETKTQHYAAIWHKLGEVKNKCALANFVVLAINMPKSIKISLKIWQSYDKNNFDFFLRHGVYRPNQRKGQQYLAFHSSGVGKSITGLSGWG